jgi:predicted nucleic acid-binding protein
MKESLYLETSVISYYNSRPSRDVIILAHQEITRQWWPKAINNFDIFVSEIVIKEASMGDQEAAKRRLDDLKNFRILKLTEEVEKIAKVYMELYSSG